MVSEVTGADVEQRCALGRPTDVECPAARHLEGWRETVVRYDAIVVEFCSGEVMADLALDGGSRFDLSLFRLRRFDRF